jgi:CRISPR-associated exonuclease Cas4
VILLLDASEDDGLVPISALQHFAFCERQCALIHVERSWSENDLTAEGRVVHERVDLPGLSGRGRVVRGLQLRCDRLGLVGRADVVEFLAPATPGQPERPFPVEYKRGRMVDRLPDRVQLCAQAIALEEMLAVPVPYGALFYHASRHRVDVAFDPALREVTEATAEKVRRMLQAGKVPTANLEPKCRRCSLRDVCQPAAPGRSDAARYLAAVTQEAGGADPA